MGCGYSSMPQSVRDEIYEIEHDAIKNRIVNLKSNKNIYLESNRENPVSMWR